MRAFVLTRDPDLRRWGQRAPRGAEVEMHVAAVDDPADITWTRERVDGFLGAVMAVASDLDLQQVLRRIVEVAVTLVDARYGALGVVDDGGQGLSQFITVGFDEDTASRIGPPPTGHGVLGELLRNPTPLRLLELAAHPASSGFPPHHPPMQTLLGVPVRVGQAVFGNLYLTEKRAGQAFTEDDESVLVALAAAAGVAVQNARLYDESRRRGAWMDAGREVSTSLLSGSEPDDVLALVVDRARELLEADAAFVAFCGADGLQWQPSTGAGDLLVGLAGELDDVVTLGRSCDLTTADGRQGTAVPLGPHGLPAAGVLVALWAQRPPPAVTAHLTGFAAQAAVVLELATRRLEVERFAIVDDRDRIGRDLHDLVIQRLFSTGMQLQSAIRLVDTQPVEATARVNHAVDELDMTIRELRSTIYGLTAPLAGRPSLRAQVLAVVEAASAQLGFPASVRLDGLLDTLASPEVAEHALATLREALSNVARHAGASRADVVVGVVGDSLRVLVEDDGRGLPQGGTRSGLHNLAARAAELGGTLELSTAALGGARLDWQVPL